MQRIVTHINNSSLTEVLTGREATVHILRVLAYFDIFHYPLTKNEIAACVSRPLPGNMLDAALAELLATRRIFAFKEFYLLQENPLLVYRRMEQNQRAAILLRKADRIGRFLGRFPFVRAIGISGSLSKQVAAEKEDIDFFIITAANRLWVARTIMHLYKKLTFLTGQQHYHCMNYYIDEEALMLEERNIFTAVELKTLLPVYGKKTLQSFFEINAWANGYLPAYPFRDQPHPDQEDGILKRTGEWLLGGRAGSWLNRFCMRITIRRWQHKTDRGKRNGKGLVMGLISGPHFARSNPGAFQERVLAAYEEKLRALGAGE